MRRSSLIFVATIAAFVVIGCDAPSPPPLTSAATTTTTISDAEPTTTTEVPPKTPAPHTRILYSSNRDTATYQIFSTNIDGSGLRRITTDDRYSYSWPRPNPAGTKILYYRADAGKTVNEIDTNALWEYDVATDTERELIPRGGYGWVAQGHVEWSPDGTTLVMVGGSTELGLWITDAEGQNPRRLTNRRSSTGGALATIDPSWGPDGSTIMFTGCPRDRIFCFPWDYEVFRLDLRTGQELRLTFDSTADFDPYLTPDGSRYVWLKCSGGFPFGPWALYQAEASFPVPTPLIDDGQTNANAMMSNDSTGIVFSRNTSAMVPGQRLFTMSFDSKAPTQVPQTTPPAKNTIYDEMSPAWW
jgi:Tol biopolymer transport system component